jgi:hypothetical protein
MDSQQNDNQDTTGQRTHASTESSRSIDWYAEGEERVVEVGGVQVVVRFVGRKGRRGRIAITAPAGALFRSLDKCQDGRSLHTLHRDTCTQSLAVERQGQLADGFEGQ